MTDSRADGPSAVEFRRAREEWIEGRIQDLADVLETAGPDLYELLPTDLGERRLAAAVTVARVAADEARAESVAETVRLLERLIPGGHRHDLTGMARALRSRLATCGEPAVWSWNAAAWEELALWWWRRHQPRTGDPARDFTEWRSRWSAEIPWNGSIDQPELAPRRHGRALVTPAEFFASEPEPLRLLAHAVLKSARTVAVVEDTVLLREEHLQGAGHLRWLAEQQVCADQLEAWCRAQQETGSEAARAFLAELSEAVKRYATLVLRPVVDALSACERALLDGSRPGEHRNAADYLDMFLDWQVQSDEDAWRDDAPSADVARQARQHREQGETTWQGMRGSVPVWYHIVASPQEKAAALAYSGRPSASVVRVRTGDDDVTVPGLSLFEGFFDEVDESADWYPDPGIDVPYEPDSAFDLCALLALTQLGHARLEFLTVHADGTVRTLRSVRALVREDDAKPYRRWALAALTELAPDPEDLADLIARDEEEGTDEPDETTRTDKTKSTGNGTRTGGTPSPEQGGSPSGRRTTNGSLPPELLSKVRALLRKAEDQAATEEEARAFLAKATELMAKYGIEQAMLEDLDRPAGPLDKVVEVHPPYAKEMRRLLSWIAEAMRCRSVYPGGKANRQRVHLFGFEGDIQASEVLFASLRLQMLDGADRADRLHRPAGEDVRAYKRSWMLGFLREVTDRVKAAQAAARAAAEHEQEGVDGTGRSVALVLADRSTVVDAHLNDRYPTLGKVRPTKFKGTGYWQGRADGRRADIGGPTIDPDTRTEQLIG